MLTKTIKGLNQDEQRILKQIVSVLDRHNNESEVGSILYSRLITEEYNLIKQAQEDEKQSNSIDKFLTEYPKQKNYPVDEIDRIILGAIKSIYPKSIVKNELILFNVDLERLQVLRNRNIIKSEMYLCPDLANVYNPGQYAGKEFKVPTITFNIYSYYMSEFLEGQTFFAKYNLMNKEVLEKLSHVKFE